MPLFYPAVSIKNRILRHLLPRSSLYCALLKAGRKEKMVLLPNGSEERTGYYGSKSKIEPDPKSSGSENEAGLAKP